MSNPFIKNNNLLYYGLVWALLSCAHFFILYFFFQLSFIESFFDSLIFNALFSAVGLGLWFMVRYTNVEKRSFLTILLNHISAAIIVSFLWILFSYVILRISFASDNYLSFLNSSLPWRFLKGVFYYSILTLIYYVVLFYSQYQEKKIREASLVIKTQESELKRLRAQINPHFIFNTLNSISALTLISPEKAQEMVIRLSDFLRYSLKHDSRKKVTCKEELDNVKLYMEIEKTRFGERFIYFENIEPACYQKVLPDMLLQPLFENALKHGVYESLEPVTIQLTCTCDEEYLYIRLGNTYSPGEKKKKGTGTGIANIQNRLMLTYGRNDLFRITKKDDYFETLVTLPQN